MECDLYNVGKALGDLNDLDQHVNWLCKALEQRGGEDKRDRRRSPGHPKSKCRKICVKPNAPGKGSMKGRCCARELLEASWERSEKEQMAE